MPIQRAPSVDHRQTGSPLLFLKASRLALARLESLSGRQWLPAAYSSFRHIRFLMSIRFSTNAPEASPVSPKPANHAMSAFLIRLHLYIGLFIGPFIFVAALSGLLYALTPQLEERLYAEQLFTQSRGAAQPVARQIAAARAHIGEAGVLTAIRPAPESGTTTRVIFTIAGSGPSESKAVFVDPVTTEVRGTLMVYGTSGVLPLRTWIDHFHRSLLLGDWGRLYSELAASWLWIGALSGLILWIARRRRNRSPVPPVKAHRVRRWHAILGLWLLAGLLLISVTGLTWSKWAGGNIGVARAALGMSTPRLSTRIKDVPAPAIEGHAHHGGMSMPPSAPVDLAHIDAVLSTARNAGIEARKIEIRPASAPERAWTVTEINRSWPTEVDAVAIDPHTLTVVDRIEFEYFPLAAKLTRWGIDVHMGALFGLPNQLILAAVAGGLLTLVVWGYLMWWRRRRRAVAAHYGLVQALRQLSLPAQLGIAAPAMLLGYCLPVLGASLAAFILFDVVIGATRNRRKAHAAVS
jgi:uncharacterized iron-regulated membrane protein